jgi:hypothetical protein
MGPRMADKPRSLQDLRKTLRLAEEALHVDPMSVTEEDVRGWIELLDDLFVNVGNSPAWNKAVDNIIPYLDLSNNQKTDQDFAEDASDVIEIIYTTRTE